MEIFNDLGLGLIHISDSKFVNPIQRMDSLICLQLFRAAIKTNLSKLAGWLAVSMEKEKKTELGKVKYLEAGGAAEHNACCKHSF